MDVSDHFLSSAAQNRVASTVYFNNTWRDGIQSLMGTNPSAKEMVDAHPHAGEIGNGTNQTGGGTFYDLFARKGRDPNESIRIINAAYPESVKTALFRNECGVSYGRKSPDVIKEVIRQHARAGVQVFQNFHGLNDTSRTEPIDRMVQEVAREEGLNIYSAAGICIEADNPNITVESCLAAARKRVEAGCKGFYLKSASGRVEPDFARALVGALLDEFPDQAVDVHIHETYGEALPAYMAAIEAGAARGKSVGVDVLHPAIAGNTAQPDILKVRAAILNHPDQKVRAMAPEVNMEAIEADMDSLLDLRMRYRDAETKYNPRLLKAMRSAKAAGGASATLRGIPGLEANLSAALGTKDWNEIQVKVYEMQAKILPRLGNPTQVTPYALMTTVEAVSAIMRQAQGKDPLSDLNDATVDYLVGRLGRVPESADPALVKMALKKANLERPVDLSAEPLASGMESARRKLKEKGIENPSGEDVLIAATVGDKANPDMGVNFVVNQRNGRLSPQKPAPSPIARFLGVGLNDGAPASEKTLASIWRGDYKGRGINEPALGPELLEAIGGPAAFEQLAQDVLTIEKGRYRALSSGKVPEYLQKVEEEWLDNARAGITDFYNRIGSYASKEGLKKGEAVILNNIIQNMCAGKGVGEIDQGIIPSLQAARAPNPAYVPSILPLRYEKELQEFGFST